MSYRDDAASRAARADALIHEIGELERQKVGRSELDQRLDDARRELMFLQAPPTPRVMPGGGRRRGCKGKLPMKNHLAMFTLSSLLAAAAGTASAQPRDGITGEAPATPDSIEISLGGSYAQGGGTMGSPELGNRGGGAELAVGGRFVGRHLAISAYGTLDALADDGQDNDTAAASIGAKADWHFVPMASVDPWVSLGAGAKIQWSGDRDVYGGTRLGVELAKAQAGVDLRVTPSFHVGPTIGASATLFTHENTDMSDGYDTIDDKRVDLMFTAGLQGRFDLLGASR